MYVRVHVTPGAKKEKVIKESDTLFYISVREPALQNMANTRIREILAHEFTVPLGQVQILTGHRSCGKMVSIDRK